MPLEEHAPRHGPAARLDPRAKLLAALGFSLVVALAPGWPGPALGLGLGLAMIPWSRLPGGLLVKRALGVNLFVVFLWVFLPWRLDWADGLALSYAPEGLVLAGLITLKVNAIFLCLSVLVGTSTVNQVLHALAHLKLPAKLVTLFMLFYRYLHLLEQEYRRLRQAMTVRGFVPGTNLHTYRSYARLLAMLLVRSVDRSERVYQAMLCRGFAGTFWLLDHFAWRRADSAFCTASGVILLGLALVQWGGPLWS